MIYLKSLIHLLDSIKLMAQWPGHRRPICMGQLIYFQHACKRYQVYSLDPTSNLFIEVFGVHLLPELLVLSRFQAARFAGNLWQWFHSKSGNQNWQFLSSTIVLQLLACFQKWELLYTICCGKSNAKFGNFKFWQIFNCTALNSVYKSWKYVSHPCSQKLQTIALLKNCQFWQFSG